MDLIKGASTLGVRASYRWTWCIKPLINFFILHQKFQTKACPLFCFQERRSISLSILAEQLPREPKEEGRFKVQTIINLVLSVGVSHFLLFFRLAKWPRQWPSTSAFETFYSSVCLAQTFRSDSVKEKCLVELNCTLHPAVSVFDCKCACIQLCTAIYSHILPYYRVLTSGTQCVTLICLLNSLNCRSCATDWTRIGIWTLRFYNLNLLF